MDAFLEFCLFLRICSVHALMLLKALAAVNGPVIAGLERNLCGLSTIRANCVKHFTLPATLIFAGSTASFAAYGFILESFFRVELLLARGKDELRATIFAHQHFVFEHVSFPFCACQAENDQYPAVTDLAFNPTPANWKVRS